MNANFIFKNSEQVRRNITEQDLKNICRMYESLYEETAKKAGTMGKGGMQAQNLVLLKKTIQLRLKEIDKEIESGIVKSMRVMSENVTSDKIEFLKACGFKDKDILNAFIYVPDQIVRNILTGNVYQNGWTLSSSIWKNSQKVQGDINTIISKGTASGKSALDIARDLEKFVDPSAQKASRRIKYQKYKRSADGKLLKDEKGNYIPEGRSNTFYFGKVDYNAQRLARTLVSHAYQQSFKAVNENDPFVTEYVWHSSGLHGRTCQICLDRDGKHFKKDELPQDHPNGMCTYEAYIPYSMTEIADKIADWYESPTGTYPDIDRYAMDFVEVMK